MFLAAAKINTSEIRLPSFREIKYMRKLVRIRYMYTFSITTFSGGRVATCEDLLFLSNQNGYDMLADAC